MMYFHFVYSPGITWLRITLAMLGKLGISGSFAIIYVFSAELFPTVVRTIGVGTGSMHARIGGLIAPFVAELVSCLYYFVFCYLPIDDVK